MKKSILIVTIVTFAAMLMVFSCGDKSTGGESDDDNIGSSSGGSSSGGTGCGNGVIEGDEACDGPVACWEVGHYYPENNAECNSDCTALDKSKCQEREPGDKCGNGEIDYPEVCEMGDTKPCKEMNPNFQDGDSATCNRKCNGWDTFECKQEPNGTCSKLVTCAEACAKDAACIDACKESGSTDGLTAFEALWSCYDSSCASGADMAECMKEYCSDQYYVCYPGEKCGNGTIDEGEVCETGDTKPCNEVSEDFQPMGNAVCNSTCTDFDTYACIGKDQLSCIQLFECVKECAGDETCVSDTCIIKAYPAATSKYNAFEECAQTSCPEKDEACLNENCRFQYNACKTHATCGNDIIDEPYEQCEKGEKVDCGTIKKEDGSDKFESGTANAYCDMNCVDYTTTGCYGFCSCANVKKCVEDTCGGYINGTFDCISECQSHGSSTGKNQHKSWKSFIESCCDQNGTSCGFDNQDCVDKANQDIGCDSGSDPQCDL